MKKKALSLLLTLSMLLSLVPAFEIGAMAAETPTEVSTEEGLAAGGYLKLTQDITLTNNCPLPDNTTIALNGHTIYQGNGMLLSGTGLVFEIASADDLTKAKTIFNWIAAGTYTWKLKDNITITEKFDTETSNE